MKKYCSRFCLLLNIWWFNLIPRVPKDSAAPMDSVFSHPRGMFNAKLYVWTAWAGLCFQRHRPFYLLQHSQSPTRQLMPMALLMQGLIWICVISMWEDKLERFPGGTSVSVKRCTCLVPRREAIHCSPQTWWVPYHVCFLRSGSFFHVAFSALQI